MMREYLCIQGIVLAMPLKRKPPPGNVRRVQAISNNLRYTITNKCGRIIQCESHLERKLTLVFEQDKQVVDYMSQPEELTWIDAEGKNRSYIPDFIVWRVADITELHEVTLTQRRNKPVHREQAAEKICQMRGWQYIVHTEVTLPTDVQLVNLTTLYPFRATAYYDEHLHHHFLKRLAQSHYLSGELLVETQHEINVSLGQIYPALYHAIWHKTITVDWETLLFEHGRLRHDILLKLNRND
jgi:hypothetical protein